MKSLDGIYHEWSLWLEIGMLFLALITLFFVVIKFLSYLFVKFPRFHFFAAPVRIALIGGALLYLFYWIINRFALEALASYWLPLKKCLFVLILTFLVTGYLKEFFRKTEKKAKRVGITRGKLSALNKLARFSVYMIASLILFQVFGLNIGPILTFGGIGVAAFALASQDIISNFFGGIMIFIKRPFYEGDYIVIPSRPNFLGGITGIVEEVGIYATILKDAKNRFTYFPNSLFCQSVIINESRQEHVTITGKLSLSGSSREKLSMLINECREKMDAGVAFSVGETIFNNEEIVLKFFLFFQKMEQDAFIIKKLELFELLYKITAPFEGKVQLSD